MTESALCGDSEIGHDSLGRRNPFGRTANSIFQVE